jgi:O-antigen/teichoic acid export membrane protein
MRFALLTQLLVQPFEMWWYARRMAMLNGPDGPARVARAIEGGSVVALVAGGLAAAIGPMLVELAAPPEYRDAATMVPFLAAVLTVQALANLASTGSYAARTGTLPMLVNATTTVVALGGYLVLIPRTGIAGAIAANLIAEAVRLTLFETLSQRRVRLDYRFNRLLPLAAGCVAAAVWPQYVGGVGGAALGVATMGGVVALAAILGLVPLPARLLPGRMAVIERLAAR